LLCDKAFDVMNRRSKESAITELNWGPEKKVKLIKGQINQF